MTHPSQVTLNVVQTIAIIFAGIWVFGTFTFSEIFKPANQNSYLQASIAITERGDIKIKSGGEVKLLKGVLVKVTIDNKGPKRTKIASGYLEIHADTVKENTPNHFTKESLQKTLNEGKAALSKYFGHRDTELVFIATAFNDGWWFSPGEKHSFERLFYIPKDKYSHLEANIYILNGPDADKINVSHVVDDGKTTHEYHIDYASDSEDDFRKHARFADSTAYLVLSDSN